MLRWLRRWPPAAWLAVYVGSLFIINGGHGDPPQLILGIVLCLGALAAGVYLAIGRWEGHPVPRGFFWAFAGVASIYLISAAVAALYDPLWAAAALAAGVVPLTAVALLFATARSKTVQRDDGRVADVSAAREDDPFPAIGMNNTPQPEEETPEDQMEGERGAGRPREPRFERGRTAADGRTARRP